MTTSRGYVRFEVSVKGPTLILHNGRTSNPLDPFAKAMRLINSKRKKTEADYAALANLEFEAGLYLNAAKEVIIPSIVIESALAVGARRSKEGKQALAGCFVDTDLVLNYEGGPKTLDELKEDPEFRISSSVRVGTSRVMRTRPFFKNWSGSFHVSLNSEVANESQVRRWIEDTGAFIGLCDWRPRHGRFDVIDFSKVG